MPEEPMEILLRHAMAPEPVPSLSSSFECRLAQRLAPTRLKPQARLIMLVYAVIAILISVWALRSAPVSANFYFILLLAAIAALVPCSYAWTLYRSSRSQA
jgi:hypothetical protein